MLDQCEKITVSELSESDWDDRVGGAPAQLPFAARCWINLGLAGSPGMRFVPLAVRWGRTGDVLVPLCVSPTSAQIGCFGYGSVLVSAGWRADRLPDFPELADAVCTAAGLATLTTLVPPAGAFDGLERAIGHWRTRPGRATFLLDLTGGPGAVWSAARGSSRTAVRRGRALGMSAARADVADGARLLGLHKETMSRNATGSGYREADIAFLLEDLDNLALTTVVRDDDGIHAASVFAVGAGTAFHIMQLTSEHGRRTNAGHLAFWEATVMLADRGIGMVDLGAAAGAGQERFKLSWGGVPAAARVLRWPAEVNR